MKKRHVIILAQGQQTRLPELAYPKQLLALPLCADVPILARTLIQCRELDPGCRITVVSKEGMYAPIFGWRPGRGSSSDPAPSGAQRIAALVGDRELETCELPDPGNSSLKGCSRYLDHRRDCMNLQSLDFDPHHTVVLLGDACYSWRCMSILFSDALPYTFVGTSNISESAGELWGLNWRPDADEPMIQWMKKALRKHPPFHAYQCGQMRQWMFVGRAELEPQPILFASVDDYTKDFDVPADLEQLYAVSQRAADDDRTRGLVWGPSSN